MEAYKSKDQAAIAKAAKENQELNAPMYEAMKKSQAELEDVLTEEQVKQLPGGGIQVMIGEGGAAGLQARASSDEAMKSAKARMREKVKRQRELVEQAWQLCEKLDAVGEGKPGEAHALWEKLEAVQGELRRTLEATPPRAGWMPGAPLPGQPPQAFTVPFQPLAGAAPRGPDRQSLERALRELKEKAEKLAQEGKTEQAERVKHEARELQETLQRSASQPNAARPLPGQPLIVRPDPAVQELRSQMQDLRRQVEELRAQLKKLSVSKEK